MYLPGIAFHISLFLWILQLTLGPWIWYTYFCKANCALESWWGHLKLYCRVVRCSIEYPTGAERIIFRRIVDENCACLLEWHQEVFLYLWANSTMYALIRPLSKGVYKSKRWGPACYGHSFGWIGEKILLVALLKSENWLLEWLYTTTRREAFVCRWIAFSV